MQIINHTVLGSKVTLAQRTNDQEAITVIQRLLRCVRVWYITPTMAVLAFVILREELKPLRPKLQETDKLSRNQLNWEKTWKAGKGYVCGASEQHRF